MTQRSQTRVYGLAGMLAVIKQKLKVIDLGSSIVNQLLPRWWSSNRLQVKFDV
jgi:hypothetical protein